MAECGACSALSRGDSVEEAFARGAAYLINALRRKKVDEENIDIAFCDHHASLVEKKLEAFKAPAPQGVCVACGASEGPWKVATQRTGRELRTGVQHRCGDIQWIPRVSMLPPNLSSKKYDEIVAKIHAEADAAIRARN